MAETTQSPRIGLMVVCLIRGEIVSFSMGKAEMARAMTHESRGEGLLLPPARSLEESSRRVEPAHWSLEVVATARHQAKSRSIRLKLNS